MITAVDTSVLLDVFGADATFGPGSRAALSTCIAEGSLLACDVVWAETATFFPSAELAHDAMDTLGVQFSALTRDAALAASDAWKSHRRRGGRRERIVADFLIGAHAATQAERLLTRDRGFYRACFDNLTILDPAADHPC